MLCSASGLTGLRGRPADGVRGPLALRVGGGAGLFLLKASVAPWRAAAAASEEPVVWLATGFIAVRATLDGGVWVRGSRGHSMDVRESEKAMT